MADSVRSFIEIAAPPERVWHALIDHREFGSWFRVRLDGPFELGRASTGQIIYPGYEHIRWEATMQEIEPQRRFVFTWGHVDETGVPIPGAETVVMFTLEPTQGGTRVRVTETGFESLPAEAGDDARRRNAAGWEEQMGNIAAYVAQHP